MNKWNLYSALKISRGGLDNCHLTPKEVEHIQKHISVQGIQDMNEDEVKEMIIRYFQVIAFLK